MKKVVAFIFNEKKEYPIFLLLSIIWLAIILIVNPTGEFPFADDFAYTKPVKVWLETGTFKMTDWSSMTLVGHLFIGCIVSKLFGFSFLYLRLINLFFGLLATFAGFKIFKIVGFDNRKSFVFTLFLMFNPFFVFYNFTYYTDITFVCFFLWSIYFYTKYLLSFKNSTLIIALLFNIYAFLIRDLAIFIPFGFFITLIYLRKINKRNLFINLLPSIVLLAEYGLYRYWIVNVHGLTAAIEFGKTKMFDLFSSGIVKISAIYIKSIIYLFISFGLFLLPINLLLINHKLNSISKKNKKILLSISIIIPAIFCILIFKFNELYVKQIDMLLDHLYLVYYYQLIDIHNPSNEFNFVFPHIVIYIVAFVGFSFGIYLLFLFAKSFFQNFIKEKNIIYVFFASTLIIYFFFMSTVYSCNRYYLPLICIFISLLFFNLQFKLVWNKITVLGLILFLTINFYTSIAGIHDMLLLNRTKWEAIWELQNKMKIDKSKIDAGFDFGAWYSFSVKTNKKKGQNWWWVEDDEYMVSHGTIKGYIVIKEYDFYRWFPPNFHSKIYILHRGNNK